MINIEEQLEIKEYEFKVLKLYKKIISIEPRNITEEIFIKYIELLNAAEVSKYMNKKEYKLIGAYGRERKYKPEDIGKALNNDTNVNIVRSYIFNIARDIRGRSWETNQSNISRAFKQYIKE